MYTRKSNGGADRTLFPPGTPHLPGVSFLRPPSGRENRHYPLFVLLLICPGNRPGRILSAPYGALFLCRKDGVTVTARQKKFAEYYAQSGNTVQSAIQAGYSEAYANSTACKLLENARVAEYIRELSDKAQDERIMTAKERQALLSDMAKDDENAPADRIRAIDTLNKMTGEYVTKVQGSIQTEVNNPFSKLSTDDLKKLITDG